MKRTLRVYKKTVSIVNETAIGMYQNLVGNKVGFLLESYDKNYDRYTFMGAEPEELISSEGQSLVITRAGWQQRSSERKSAESAESILQ